MPAEIGAAAVAVDGLDVAGETAAAATIVPDAMFVVVATVGVFVVLADVVPDASAVAVAPDEDVAVDGDAGVMVDIVVHVEAAVLAATERLLLDEPAMAGFAWSFSSSTSI